MHGKLLKLTVLLLGGGALILVSLTSCSTSPADAAVDAATSNMGPAQSAAVRRATGHGTGPVERVKRDTSDRIDDFR